MKMKDNADTGNYQVHEWRRANQEGRNTGHDAPQGRKSNKDRINFCPEYFEYKKKKNFRPHPSKIFHIQYMVVTLRRQKKKNYVYTHACPNKAILNHPTNAPSKLSQCSNCTRNRRNFHTRQRDHWTFDHPERYPVCPKTGRHTPRTI